LFENSALINPAREFLMLQLLFSGLLLDLSFQMVLVLLLGDFY